jgi:hypothetical protein
VSAASETPDRQPGLSCAAMKLRGHAGFLQAPKSGVCQTIETTVTVTAGF